MINLIIIIVHYQNDITNKFMLYALLLKLLFIKYL